MIPFFFFAAVILAAGFFITRSKKENSANWLAFFAKGKEAGFTLREMEQLRQISAGCNIQDPASIFKSLQKMETVIRTLVHTVRMSGEINDLPTQDFLAKLFDYCKKIEMEVVENKVRISTSRQINEGQILRVLVPNVGVYKSEVIKNYGNYITISRPVNQKLSASMPWEGLKISIYFWREDDAGYVFDTEVMDEVFSKGISSLKVEHNDSLFRTQKRKHLRIKFKKNAFLYMVRENESPHVLERAQGLLCMMEDISESGCAFRISGQATEGLRLKVQFSLDRIPVCMPGTVRSVDYNKEANISVVHMEADPLPIGTRNHILCEVFDLLPEEDEEELPFRVLEEEADTIKDGSQGALNV
ncbi:MAG: PilZ domain-containing protein [Treponema sp.]|nr:PilZ domain-containing protein [Treponema sp.]